jgi:hypothetical protein
MIDAPYLIEEWEQVNKSLAPSIIHYRKLPPSPFAQVSESRSDGSSIDRTIGELSLLSSRRSIWEASVCLVDYTEQTSQVADGVQTERQPSTVLGSIDFNSHFDNTNLRLSEPYFTHCEGIATLSLGEIIPAAYMLKLFFRDGIIFNQLGVLETFQECYRTYQPDWTKIRECMLAKSS